MVFKNYNLLEQSTYMYFFSLVGVLETRKIKSTRGLKCSLTVLENISYNVIL